MSQSVRNTSPQSPALPSVPPLCLSPSLHCPHTSPLAPPLVSATPPHPSQGLTLTLFPLLLPSLVLSVSSLPLPRQRFPSPHHLLLTCGSAQPWCLSWPGCRGADLQVGGAYSRRRFQWWGSRGLQEQVLCRQGMSSWRSEWVQTKWCPRDIWFWWCWGWRSQLVFREQNC